MSQSRQDALIRQLQGAVTAMFAYQGGSYDAIVWNIGSAAIPWPGSSIDSTSTAVSHGLGATPDIVLPAVTSLEYKPAVFSFDATTFNFQCRTVSGSTPSAGNSGTFFWLAIAVT